jgi:uncharacterized protein with ParB-like and HNH nuclease domain
MASESLQSLLSKAHERHLVLPDFQRDFVWKPSDVTKLISSLLNGYPIGGLLFMENSGVYGYRVLDGVPDQSAAKKKDKQGTVLILDGQQRVTSCYRAFYGALDVEKYAGRYYFKYSEFAKNPEKTGSEIEELVEFISAKKVRKDLASTAHELSRGLFPLDIIFQAPRGVAYPKWLSEYNFNNANGVQDEFGRLSTISDKFTRSFMEKVTSTR